MGFRILFLVSFFMTWAFLSAAENRTYTEVQAVKDKKIVDYYLLCPYLIQGQAEGEAGWIWTALYPEVSPIDQGPRGFDFRRSLLTPGMKNKYLTIDSVVIDDKNAYICIQGKHEKKYPFTLTFVYFDRADKSKIPAFTYHARLHEDSENDSVFFDYQKGNWSIIPLEEMFPHFDFHGASLLDPYAKDLPTKNLRWTLENLPQWGTTVRMLPIPRDDTLNEWDYRYDQFAIEWKWNKNQALFVSPTAVLSNNKLKPSGELTVVDACILLNPVLDPQQIKKVWDRQGSPQNYLSLTYKDFPESVDNTGAMEVALLGKDGETTLVGQVIYSGQEVSDFSLWRYHQDSGLMEIATLPQLSVLDFYSSKKQAKVSSDLRSKKSIDQLGCQMNLSSKGLLLSPDFRLWDLYKDLEPDYRVNLAWDGKKFVMTKEAN